MSRMHGKARRCGITNRCLQVCMHVLQWSMGASLCCAVLCCQYLCCAGHKKDVDTSYVWSVDVLTIGRRPLGGRHFRCRRMADPAACGLPSAVLWPNSTCGPPWMELSVGSTCVVESRSSRMPRPRPRSPHAAGASGPGSCGHVSRATVVCAVVGGCGKPRRAACHVQKGGGVGAERAPLMCC